MESIILWNFFCFFSMGFWFPWKFDFNRSLVFMFIYNVGYVFYEISIKSWFPLNNNFHVDVIPSVLFVKYVLIVTSLVWGVILLIRANTCPTLLLFAEDKLLCLLSLSKRVLSLFILMMRRTFAISFIYYACFWFVWKERERQKL